MNKKLCFFLIISAFSFGAEQTNWFNWIYKGSIVVLAGANLYLLKKVSHLEKDVKELKGNTIDVILPRNLNPLNPAQQNNNNSPQFTFLLNLIQNNSKALSKMQELQEKILADHPIILQELKKLSDIASLSQGSRNSVRSISYLDFPTNSIEQIKNQETNLLKTQFVIMDMLTGLQSLTEELNKEACCAPYHKNNFEICREALKKQIEQPIPINAQPPTSEKKEKVFSFGGLFRSHKNEN